MTVIRYREIVTNNATLVKIAMYIRCLRIERARVGTNYHSFFRIFF
jgi:hypothetical protein